MTKDTDHKQLATIGSRIRQRREARGLNLHELARLCGISASALSLIETGKRDLRLTSVLRITRALRINAGELFDEPNVANVADQSDNRRGYDLSKYE